MPSAKLRVDLASGVLEVEGDEKFVRDMHSEFRSYVSKPSTDAKPLGVVQEPAGRTADVPEHSEEKNSRRSGSRRKRQAPAEGTAARKSSYEPKVLTDENFGDLPAYLAPYAPKKGHKELIPLFATYIAKEKGISPFSADHIFTCYRFTKIKPPAAFTQTLYDARGKYHFIKFDSWDEILLTHIGETFVEHDIAKKAAAE